MGRFNDLSSKVFKNLTLMKVLTKDDFKEDVTEEEIDKLYTHKTEEGWASMKFVLKKKFTKDLYNKLSTYAAMPGVSLGLNSVYSKDFEKLFLDTFEEVHNYEDSISYEGDDLDLLNVQVMHSVVAAFITILNNELEVLKKK